MSKSPTSHIAHFSYLCPIKREQMKHFPILLITTLLSIFCPQLSAQENPFMEMAGRKYADYSLELVEEYTEFLKLDTVEAQKVIHQMEEVAEKTGSMEWKLRADYLKLEVFGRNRKLFEDNPDFAEKLLKSAFELLEDMKKANLPQLELQLRQKIIDYYWIYFKNYEAAFEQYAVQNKLLQAISSDDVPEKVWYYIHLADAHYYFKDYPNAISCYSKVLEEKETSSSQSSQQHARNGLGLCYRDAYNDLDMSDSYFIAITQVSYLNSNEERDREVWDGIAEGNTGNNMLLRGEYDSAIPLLKSSIDKMLKYNDYEYASGPAINLAEIYLKKGNTTEAKRYIDLAREYHNKMPQYGRLPRIYEVMSKYYATTGNTEQSIVCIDSMLTANKQYEEQFNAMLLLRMEQKESAKRQQELVQETEKRQRAQQRLLFFALGFVVISIFLVMLYVSYRRKRAAYRALVIKTQQWAQVPFVQATHEPEDDDKERNSSTEEELHPAATDDNSNETDRQLFEQFNLLMSDRKIYLNPDATLDYVASQMEINRNYLSQAVNRCTGANFTTFINEFRVKEAVRLMSDARSRNFSIEGIAFDAGFNDRKTFYRVFKKSTGFSPTTFRDNLKTVRP